MDLFMVFVHWSIKLLQPELELDDLGLTISPHGSKPIGVEIITFVSLPSSPSPTFLPVVLGRSKFPKSVLFYLSINIYNYIYIIYAPHFWDDPPIKIHRVTQMCHLLSLHLPLPVQGPRTPGLLSISQSLLGGIRCWGAGHGLKLDAFEGFHHGFEGWNTTKTGSQLGFNLSDDFMLNLEKMLEIVKQNTFEILTRKLHEFPRVQWLFEEFFLGDWIHWIHGGYSWLFSYSSENFHWMSARCGPSGAWVLEFCLGSFNVQCHEWGVTV